VTSLYSVSPDRFARAISLLNKVRPPLRAARLAPYTTFAVGGPAELLILPSSEKEAVEVLDILAGEGIPWRILGGGSNLLVSDGGVRGAAVRMGAPFDGFRFEGTTLVAAAGAKLPVLAWAAAERGLSGLEFAVGIPGTAGGAAVTNAGSLGCDMAGIVKRVRVYRPGEGIREYASGECGFVYRGSRFLTASEAVLGSACELHPADSAAVKARMWEILEERKRKFPLEWPSAGSVFKNPPGDSAGRLLEAAGLKGEERGGARISGKHANWIVNRGKARSDDVESLIRLAREKVREKFGVELEQEIVFWDD
jgi:UDP-N-acetylmuramate dehydrogenase